MGEADNNKDFDTKWRAGKRFLIALAYAFLLASRLLESTGEPVRISKSYPKRRLMPFILVLLAFALATVFLAGRPPRRVNVRIFEGDLRAIGSFNYHLVVDPGSVTWLASHQARFVPAQDLAKELKGSIILETLEPNTPLWVWILAYFEIDYERKRPKVAPVSTDVSRLTIETYLPFTDLIISGTTQPVEFGILNNRLVFVHDRGVSSRIISTASDLRIVSRGLGPDCREAVTVNIRTEDGSLSMDWLANGLGIVIIPGRELI